MPIDLGVILGSIEAWQPTINSVLLIILTLLGQKEVRKFKKRSHHQSRRQDKKLREIETVAKQTEDLVKRLEQVLDNAEGPNTAHLH